MTRVLLLALLLLAVCTVSQSDAAGVITLTADAEGTDCAIVDLAPGLVQVHVWARDADLYAIQFAAPVPSCWTGATWISDNIPVGIHIGSSQDASGIGLSVAFGVCVSDPVYVCSITFSVEGAGAECCDFPVLKAQNDGYPEIPGPIVVECGDPLHVVAATAEAVINPDAQCGCPATVPVNETTWGQIKAMYY